jgi:hypothetical protein
MKASILLLFGVFYTLSNLTAQSAAPSNENSSSGVAVSPSTLRFNTKPGSQQKKTIKITNDTKRKCRFQISFQDLAMDKSGKKEVPAPKGFRYALSKYLAVSPSYVELEPGTSKVIDVFCNIPLTDSTAIAMWTTLIVDEVRDRDKLEVPNPDKSTIGLGIYAGIGFGINVYQNPPNVAVNSVEIMKLRLDNASPLNKNTNSLVMQAKNTGDGIGYCLYYIEVTNLVTGRQTKLKVKQFGILPGYTKDIRFELPKELEKGKYSALAVLDFGDKETLQTAEVEFSL